MGLKGYFAPCTYYINIISSQFQIFALRVWQVWKIHCPACHTSLRRRILIGQGYRDVALSRAPWHDKKELSTSNTSLGEFRFVGRIDTQACPCSVLELWWFFILCLHEECLNLLQTVEELPCCNNYPWNKVGIIRISLFWQQCATHICTRALKSEGC